MIYADRKLAAVSGLSAAYLMGVDLLPLGEPPVTITVPRELRLAAGGRRLVVVRSELTPDEISDDRFAVTNPLRTGFDLARQLAFREAVVAVDAMLYRRMFTVADLRAFALAANRCHGIRRIPNVLAATDPQSGSPMETVLRLTLVAAGLPRPEAQVNVYSRDGRLLGRVDLAYRAAKVALEYEGDGHRDRGTFRRDIWRYNAMREAGWTVIRVTADDLRDPDTMLRQVRAALGAI